MASILSKRLCCFYCGQRSSQPKTSSLRKWRCKQCEAVNYLDEEGNITDPPAAETNPETYGPGASSSSPPFETADFSNTGLFCSTCVRNQHLFMTALASWFPPSDDPAYSAYERDYPKFRRNLEEQYPQVCAKCEPRVQERIDQAEYEAKADHIRRMMDRSKAGRTARQARNRSWRSWLVSVGAVGYWGSVVGQVAWDLLSALDSWRLVPVADGADAGSTSSSFVSCVKRTVELRHLPSNCSLDLGPYAGMSLVAGIFSLWWNPKLRLKVAGRGGRLVGLGEYYRAQLIVMVVRCAFWGVLKDPSSSGLPQTMLPGLHLFMILLTILSVLISRHVVQYDTRPLVNWSSHTSTAAPCQESRASNIQFGANEPPYTPRPSTPRNTERFPIEKLATPQSVPQPESVISRTPSVSEADAMDWTPSYQQQELQPTVSVYQRDQKSVLEGPLPFYGSLPPAPKPPSWNLFSQPTQKPVEQVIERNPFHHNTNQPRVPWRHRAEQNDAVFAPPKFFPRSDYTASTGLEAMFDRAFTIKSPEDEGEDDWKHTSYPSPYQSAGLQSHVRGHLTRLGLLLSSVLAWELSQRDYFPIPGNYIEVASLGIASLISGFALLESTKQPVVHWNGLEILVYFAELGAAVHLGANLPHVAFDRVYFDRYGKYLLGFMAVQEALSLLFIYLTSLKPTTNNPEDQPTLPEPLRNNTTVNHSETSWKPSHQQAFQPSNSQSSIPPLSFSSSITGSTSTPQPTEKQHQFDSPAYNLTPSNDHSFTLDSLAGNESDASDGLGAESDTETTMTTATAATDNTVRNIRYGRGFNNNNSGSSSSNINNINNNYNNSNNGVDSLFFSPRRSELGPGLSSLSLDDDQYQPFNRRVTRSQTKRQNHGLGPGYGPGTGSLRNRFGYPLQGLN